VPRPAESNFRDELTISTIRNAQRKAAATAWVEFMRGDMAAAVYDRHGCDVTTPPSKNEERTQVEEK